MGLYLEFARAVLPVVIVGGMAILVILGMKHKDNNYFPENCTSC